MTTDINTLTLLNWTAVNSEAAEEIQKGNIGEITNRVLEGDTLTITTTKGTFVFSAPELEDPNTVTGSDIASAFHRFENIGESELMSDIYLLMQLIHECFKEQRTMAREARNVERDIQMIEIGKQVEDLKAAAVTSMVMGFVSAAITLGMAGFSAAKLGGALKQQISLSRVEQFKMAQLQLNSANSKVSTLQTELNTAKANLPQDSKPQIGAHRSPEQLKVVELTKQLEVAKIAQAKAQANFDAINSRMTTGDKLLLAQSEEEGTGTLKELEMKLGARMRQVDLLSQTSQGLGQALSGLGSGLTQLQTAGAEAHRGEATKSDARAQEQVEWMQTMKDLVRDVQEKLQAIMQSQSETMKTIFRA